MNFFQIKLKATSISLRITLQYQYKGSMNQEYNHLLKVGISIVIINCYFFPANKLGIIN